MKLESFRVRNFRSVFDSGVITTEKLTAILGRNESGKTNLLLALKSLNPAEGFDKLNDIKDFPRHRKLSECTPDTPVVDTTDINRDRTGGTQCNLSTCTKYYLC
jgi:recombinational DNA repair ATPase RecF